MMIRTNVDSSSMEQFTNYLQDRITKYRDTYGLSTGKAFMLWYGIEALNLSEDTAYEASAFDGGNDKAIDFFFVDDDNERIVIAQGKFNAQNRYSPSVGEFLELVHSTDWLQNPESLDREGRSDLAEAGRDYNDAIDRGYTVDFHFVYMGDSHRGVVAASANFNNANLAAKPIRMARVVHNDGLRQIHEEAIDASTRISTAAISLSPDMAFQQHGPYGKSLTATIPGTELQNLYNAYGDALFDRNVRVFLGARSRSVNAGIRDTLASTDRRNFWAYNNGITFICDRYEFDESTGCLFIHNFSIVNGCQTTVSVANGPNPTPSEVAILARFIAASDDEVVDSIIRYTNAQTPIRPWDIASQDSTQKRLKREFAQEPNPFFYELRRGEAGHLSPPQRRSFMRGSKFQVIKPDVLAQFLAAFRGLPIQAYRYKASLFTTHRDAIFPSDLRIEEAILAWLAGDAAEQVVKDAIAEAQQRGEDQRLRILRRGAKLFTLAVMGTILAERNGPTYLTRIKREVASSNANRKRLAKYATIAVTLYAEAMQELIDNGSDLNQLIRNEDTFNRIRSKVLTRWKVLAMSQQWVDDALPRL